MWEKLAFLFLFIFTGFYVINTRYHHVNEVFNAINHDYLYHVTVIDMENELVYFDKIRTRALIGNHFAMNLKNTAYSYQLDFFIGGEICPEGVKSAHFKVNLKATIGFNLHYDKTFSYYLY